MLKFLKLTGLCLSVLMMSSAVSAAELGIGRTATPAEIKIWDIDVRPDGQGLPEGRGTVEEGEEIFSEKCASCHGEFGEGNGRWPVLAGGSDTLTSEDPVKTIGSYWPYLSTAFDYIKRAMPFGEAQTLTSNETYAILAYLLYLNDLMEDDGELTRENFTSFKLPNEGSFVEDQRPDAQPSNLNDLCMSDCKTEVKITKRARALDVTPDKSD